MVGLNYQILCFLLFVSLEVGFLFGLSLNFLESFDGLTGFLYLCIKLFGLITGLGKVLLECIIFLIESANFSLKVLGFAEQFFLLMLEILLMCIIVDVASEQFLDLSFFVEDLLIFLNQHFLKLLLLLPEHVILHLRIFNIDLYLSNKLLEVLHFFLVIVIIVVQLIVALPQLLPLVFGELQILLHFFDHLGFIDLSLLCFLLHELFVVNGVVAVLGLNILAFFQYFLLFVLALLGQDTHLSLALIFQLLKFVLVKFDVKCLLFVQFVCLFVQLAHLYQFLLLQSKGLV